MRRCCDVAFFGMGMKSEVVSIMTEGAIFAGRDTDVFQRAVRPSRTLAIDQKGVEKAVK